VFLKFDKIDHFMRKLLSSIIMCYLDLTSISFK
jgi:hypothetical protein